MNACKQELCMNWSGDGRVCPCALFDLSPVEPEDYSGYEDVLHRLAKDGAA